MDRTPAQTSEALIKHLKPIAMLQDSLGNDLHAAELLSAIRLLKKGLPAAGSDDAERLDSTLEDAVDYLEGSGYLFLAKELHDVRTGLLE